MPLSIYGVRHDADRDRYVVEHLYLDEMTGETISEDVAAFQNVNKAWAMIHRLNWKQRMRQAQPEEPIH